MYSVPITRLHPTAFVVLIDQSGSMNERVFFSGNQMTKARAVALVTNSFIDELIHRARREGGIRDYYDMAVVGYSGEGIRSLISPDGELTTPSKLAAMNVRRENVSRKRALPSGNSVLAVTEQNAWITEKAYGTTPMCEALSRCFSLVESWCASKRNSKSFPPTVINITDGESSDCDPALVSCIARKIRETGTADGNTILMNIHLCGSADQSAMIFPSSPGELPDRRYARLLWDISSEMPAVSHDMIRAMRPEATPPFRAMGWGCHIGGVAAMMNIGSVNSVMP